MNDSSRLELSNITGLPSLATSGRNLRTRGASRKRQTFFLQHLFSFEFKILIVSITFDLHILIFFTHLSLHFLFRF